MYAMTTSCFNTKAKYSLKLKSKMRKAWEKLMMRSPLEKPHIAKILGRYDQKKAFDLEEFLESLDLNDTFDFKQILIAFNNELRLSFKAIYSYVLQSMKSLPDSNAVEGQKQIISNRFIFNLRAMYGSCSVIGATRLAETYRVWIKDFEMNGKNAEHEVHFQRTLVELLYADRFVEKCLALLEKEKL